MLTILTITPLFHLSAQQRTYSPLSGYGLGETQQIGYSATSGMGGTGIAMRSSYGINNKNVASLTALDSLSFYFDGGITHFWQSQNTSDGDIDNSDIVFDYIALAFSVTPKFTSTFGFKPVSSAGYKFLETKTLADNSIAYNELTGSGNLTQAYIGFAGKPMKNLSVGATFGYLFGNIRNISKSRFENASALKFGIYNEIRVSSLIYDFGAQYKQELSDTRSLTFGVTYRPKIGLRGDSTSIIARGGQFADDNTLFDPRSGVDTLRSAKGNLENNDLEYASSFGFGVSYNIQNKLSVGLDYSTELWADANHFDKSFEYKNSANYSVGAEYIPNDRSAKSYLARVRYRAGAYYREENMRIRNSDLSNYGITFGIGLPLKRSRTSINLSVELGKRDSSGNDNFKQSYGKLTANFSLHELWFYKRKFD